MIEGRRIDEGGEPAASAQRADTPDDVARRPLRVGRLGEGRSMGNGGAGQALEVQFPIDGHESSHEPIVGHRDERLEHPVWVHAERLGGLESVARPLVPLAAVVLGRVVGQHLEADPGASNDIDRGCPLGRHGPDATDFGYAPGGPGPRRAQTRVTAPDPQEPT